MGPGGGEGGWEARGGRLLALGAAPTRGQHWPWVVLSPASGERGTICPYNSYVQNWECLLFSILGDSSGVGPAGPLTPSP